MSHQQLKTSKRKLLGAFVCLSVMGSCIAGALLAEIYVRAFPTGLASCPNRTVGRPIVFDPAVYARSQLAQNLPHSQQDPKINRWGYKGKDFSPDKPVNKFRIMIYGGSSVYDIFAEPERDWPSLVEDELHRQGLQQVEVINAGVPGHTSVDSFGRLLTEGHEFDPDVVLIYQGWNDLKYWKETRSLLKAQKPLVPLRNPFKHYQNGMDRQLCKVSALYSALRTKYYLGWISAEKERRMAIEERIESEDESTKPVQAKKIRQFQYAMAGFVDMVRNIGARPILLTQGRLPIRGNAERVKDFVSYRYAKMFHQELVAAFDTTSFLIHEIGRKKQVPVIDIDQKISGKRDYFVDHVHTTPAGSEEIAKIVSQGLMEIISLDRPTVVH